MGGGGDGGGSDFVTVAVTSSWFSPSWHCWRCRNRPLLNLVASAPWIGDSVAEADAARTMVRDWAMLGTCRVSQLPPITPSSFSELCETERLDDDCDSCLLLRPSARPSLWKENVLIFVFFFLFAILKMCHGVECLFKLSTCFPASRSSLIQSLTLPYEPEVVSGVGGLT